jgi:hypothetical protein
MREQFEEQVSNFEQSHLIRWNSWNEGAQEVTGRERLIQNLEKKYESIAGNFRDPKTGARIDLQQKIMAEVLAKQKDRFGQDRPLIKNANLFSEYVSPFKPRSESVLSSHSKEMSRIIKKEIEAERLEFVDEAIKSKLIDTFSKNFIATDSESGPVYHKVTEDGIISPRSWTLTELIQQFGVGKFIDSPKSSLSKELYEGELRQQAGKMLGIEVNQANADKLNKKVQELIKFDVVRVGKSLKIDSEYLKNEFEKEIRITGNINEATSTLQDLNRMKAVLNNKLAAIDSLEPIKAELSQISTPQPPSWEF